MAELYNLLKPENTYFDRKSFESQEDYNAALDSSTTVYVGNLSFFTTQDSLRQLFSFAGRVTDIIMGINDEGNPCGFCFVIFESHEEAAFAVEYISKTKLNDRIIRVDWDPGYKQGREKGRGSGGQQRRDDFRTKEDAERPRKRTFTSFQGKDRQDNRNQRHEGRNDRRYDRNYDRGDREREYRGQRERGYRDRERNNRQRDRGDKDRGEKDRGDGGDKGTRGDRERDRQRDTNRDEY